MTLSTQTRGVVSVSDPRNCSRSGGNAQRGFTLIEIIAVIMIIALLTSGIALRLNAGGKKTLDEEARRVNALVRLASEQALLQGRDLGMSIENNGYSFYLFDNFQRQWLSLETERIFRSRTLPKKIRMDLNVEENSVTWPEAEDETLGSEDDEEKTDEALTVPTPQVLMLSSGEITPFDLYFEMDKVEMALQLRVGADGEREIIEHEYGL